MCLAFLPLLISYLVRTRFRDFFLAPFGANREPQVAETTREINVRPIDNPFTINLDAGKSSARDGLFVDVFRSNKMTSFNMVVAWCVQINEFYNYIEQDHKECFYKQDSLFLSEIAQHTDFAKIDSQESDVSKFEFKIPEKCESAFSREQTEDKMKTTYPVVLCIYNEEASLESKNETDIIASIWIIHLKDKKMTNKILYNYNKRLNNQIIVVNRMFEVEQDDLCVVCKCERSNVVLLPCIHKCLCRDCFKRCSKQCPVCRAKVVNIFHV